MRTQYQVKNQTQIRTNQRVNRNDDNQLVVKNYPKNKNKQPIIQQQKTDLPNCPSCKQNSLLEFDEGFYCTNCEYIINKQKHQINQNIHRQSQDFSTRLNYSIKKIREIYVNIAYLLLEIVIDILQQLKRRIKLKFYKNLSEYYKEMKNKIFQSNKIYHEVLLLMEFLQTKPDVKNMNINYTDLYYTVIKTRYENRKIDNQYENDSHDYIDINDFIITPNHYIGIKPHETILR